MAPAGQGPAQRLQPYRVIVAKRIHRRSSGGAVRSRQIRRGRRAKYEHRHRKPPTAGDDDEDDGTGVRLYQSIYETAMRNKVPASVIEDMVRIYSYDVDVQRKVQPGDSFDVFFAGEDEGASTEKTEVLFASLTVGGETKKYYRSRPPTTRSSISTTRPARARRSFWSASRSNNAIMRSGFGSRRHPIPRLREDAHGVDCGHALRHPRFSASATASVEVAGLEGGYGKYVKLKHNNGYETAYGHLSAFAKGLEPGKRVRQGQVIGSSARPGNRPAPMSIMKFWSTAASSIRCASSCRAARSLDGPLIASFEKERDRLDAMISSRGAGARVSDAAGTVGAPQVRQVSNR